MSTATLHSVAGPGGVTEAAEIPAAHRAVVGPLERIVSRVSGPSRLLDDASRGLPPGAAAAEATAVRLRRGGVELAWGEPDCLEGPGELLEFCRARGRSSVEVWRTDRELLPELHLGAHQQTSLAHRLARRFPLPRLGTRLLRVSAERAFWAGVRAASTGPEWQRLTSSYAALVYHRLAGDGKPGQNRVDLDPRRFGRQLRLLRRLGFEPLSPEQLLAFHDGDGGLPRRCFVLTVDDGTADCREPLMAHASARPQLFVCTDQVGGQASWLGGEPLLSWEQLESLAGGGVAIGSHARSHRPLDSLEPGELQGELVGALAELRDRLPTPIPLLAYPNGRHDRVVRAAAISAGYHAAWTTAKGRNGIGTDRWCLRRVSVHSGDGPLSVLWIVAVGEAPPWRRR